MEAWNAVHPDIYPLSSLCGIFISTFLSCGLIPLQQACTFRNNIVPLPFTAPTSAHVSDHVSLAARHSDLTAFPRGSGSWPTSGQIATVSNVSSAVQCGGGTSRSDWLIFLEGPWNDSKDSVQRLCVSSHSLPMWLRGNGTGGVSLEQSNMHRKM
mmetsp:Transcript_39917/g.93703  ORF Transcript_39917/g.93703 Transcript_39917/m.93703 type:complete len:155 (+) Transcript_39917:1921-2385(+)